MKYIFGPVNSRRLGLSLGIDLFPCKICNMNCLYCECGVTSELTMDVGEYVPTEDVIAELRDYLKVHPKLDAITFSGSGEPTLHSGIERVIDFLKSAFPEYSIAVITNGSLLWREDVRRSILKSDIVVPSLDAATEETFHEINRPVEGITVKSMIEGLIKFRAEFTGKIYLEIFVVPGINDNEAEIRAIKEACLRIHPDKIQLNTIDRPGTESWLSPASREKLIDMEAFFIPLAVDIISKPYNKKGNSVDDGDITDRILSMLRRRPSTITDISSGFGLEMQSLKYIIKSLCESNKIEEIQSDRGIFYKVKR